MFVLMIEAGSIPQTDACVHNLWHVPRWLNR